MDITSMLASFGALSQETRLQAFRLLVRHEPAGLPAGEVARQLGVPHNTMSAHLSVLAHAELVFSQRQSRSIIYRANLNRMQETIQFLVHDCCAGHPQICEPLTSSLIACPTQHKEVCKTMHPQIYHNPDCGTSRNTLAMIQASGETPEVIEYLKTPPSRARLVTLLSMMQITPRELLRRNGTPYDELGLDNTALSDEQLIDAMMEHPVLINRPIVVTDKGARLCRPSELVFDLLEHPVASFIKEDGEAIHSRGAKQ
jgi:arsenate reductase (glutaredoxin)